MLWKQIKYPWRFVSYVVISLLAMESGGPCGLFRQNKTPASVVGSLSPILGLKDAGDKVRPRSLAFSYIWFDLFSPGPLIIPFRLSQSIED